MTTTEAKALRAALYHELLDDCNQPECSRFLWPVDTLPSPMGVSISRGSGRVGIFRISSLRMPGKTTLFRMVVGEETPDEGSVSVVGCPILAFFARVGGDATGATLVRSIPPVVDAVVVLALFCLREGRGTRICGGFCSLIAGPPARRRSTTVVLDADKLRRLPTQLE